MRYVGVDLHKQTISLCVVIQAGTDGGSNRPPKRFRCGDEEPISAFFAGLGPYEAVVEATASYEWFVQLIEPTAQRIVLAHPGKLRVIAESKKKTDKLDAQTLAEFLALDKIPAVLAAHAAGPRASHAGPPAVLHAGRITAAKNKLRRIVANYNADPPACSPAGPAYLAQMAISAADRFAVDLLCEELDQQRRCVEDGSTKAGRIRPRTRSPSRKPAACWPASPAWPGDDRSRLAEAGDVRRFSSQRKATAYAGLAPESAKATTAPSTWGSPRPARGCCDGRWSSPPGG